MSLRRVLLYCRWIRTERAVGGERRDQRALPRRTQRRGDAPGTSPDGIEPHRNDGRAARGEQGTALNVAVLRAAHLVVDGEPPVFLSTTRSPRGCSAATSRHGSARTPPTSRRQTRAACARTWSCGAGTPRMRSWTLSRKASSSTSFSARGSTPSRTASHPGRAASRSSRSTTRRPRRRSARHLPRWESRFRRTCVRFADVDFERETLSHGLARCGVDTAKRTFFSWLGVTQYLTRDAIEATLRTVLSFPKGSAVVFTSCSRTPTPRREPRMSRGLRLGEPWISYFTPEELGAMLRSLGFADASFLSREEAERRYYANRTDGFRRRPACRSSRRECDHTPSRRSSSSPIPLRLCVRPVLQLRPSTSSL